MNETFDDESLMAFADGEAEEASAAAIRAAMAADETLARRVATFLETREAAREAMRPALSATVPPALAAAVRAMIEAPASAHPELAGGQVVRIADRRRQSALAGDWAPMALAASLAAVVAGALGFAAGGLLAPSAPASGFSIAALRTPGLEQALATAPSGTERFLADDNRFRAIASFEDDGKAFCREFEVDATGGSTVTAVACRDVSPPSNWQVEFAVVAPSDAKGYAPASSLETLDAFLVAIGAGEPLLPDAERAFLAP